MVNKHYFARAQICKIQLSKNTPAPPVGDDVIPDRRRVEYRVRQSLQPTVDQTT